MTVARKSRSHRHRLLPTSIDDPVLMRPRGDSYLLLQQFSDDHAAPLATPHNYGPGPGKITFVEVDGSYAVSGGKIVITGQSSAAWGDLCWYCADAFTRVPGRMAIFENIERVGTVNSYGPYAGFVESITPASIDDTVDAGFQFAAADILGLTSDSSDHRVTFGTIVADTEYDFTVVLRTTGSFLFIRGGIWSDWSLVYVESISSTATLYVAATYFLAPAKVCNMSRVAVPKRLWMPTPLAYDTFTRDDSDSLGSTETTGPDGQTCIARAWVEDTGDLDIASNAMATSGSAAWIAWVETNESDVFVEADFAVAGGGTYMGLAFRLVDGLNYWLARIYFYASANHDWSLTDVAAGSFTERAYETNPVSAAEKLTVSAHGDVIRIWRDDGNSLTHTSSLYNTATKHGVRHGAGPTQMLDFAVWPINPQDFPSV